MDKESTQISVGGVSPGVTAKQLADFLESTAGSVARCRLKTSITPPNSGPNFTDTRNQIAPYEARVPPHAFVQFLDPKGAKSALKLAKRGELVLNGQPLRVREGFESFRRFEKRRTCRPYRFDRFDSARVEIGSLLDENEFMVAYASPDDQTEFHVDPFDRYCRIFITRDQLFSIDQHRKDALILCNFKVEFHLRDIASVRCMKERDRILLMFQLLNSPTVHYRTADDDIYVTVPFHLLDDEDPWIRTLDFTENSAIGRCLVYTVGLSPRCLHTVEKVMRYFKDMCVVRGENASVGVDSVFRVRQEHHMKRSPVFFTIPRIEWLNFDTLFLLNGLVQKGILNYHKLNDQFFRLLKASVTPPHISGMALKHMHTYTSPVYDALGELEKVLGSLQNCRNLSRRLSIDTELMEVRRLIITPTKALCLPPEIELANRILRYYHRYSDRFLRVTFMDESMESIGSGALNVTIAPIARDVEPGSPHYRTAIFNRIRKILFDGFEVSGRTYSFLAFSANQLRDRSAWFFANGEGLTCERIRSWMGDFPIRNVAKHAARIGQCFSSTYSTVQVPREQVQDLEEIRRNGYEFSDGIGKITPDLALEVTKKLQLNINPPSAFQIRYAGYKGVVTTWPARPGSRYKLSLRPSMKKFESEHRILEVISWTRCLPAFLNRQIITLLTALGVPDQAFSDLQASMLKRLGQMLDDGEVAFDVLTTTCVGMLSSTAAIMLSAGFKPESEPLLKEMLCAVRALQLDDLLRKCRIFVPKGRWLMGCLDELGVLEYGQCFVNVSTSSLKDCFVRHASSFEHDGKSSFIVTGKVFVAKNPCLHPGDIRVLEAVDIPELHHLVDCLVFPQKGERPHSNEASGSDLDGDMYFVSWEPTLIPPAGKSCAPMGYDACDAPQLDRDVMPKDIIEFFARHMVSDTLGVICHAHVVRADKSELGALDRDCLELAHLAAVAVDFPKTGKLAVMPPHLKPREYPDFMEKGDDVSYDSEKILGILYREIKYLFGDEIKNWKEGMHSRIPMNRNPQFDDDLLVSGFENYVKEAWKLKCMHDQQLRSLLTQFNVKREGELISGNISSISKHNKKRQGDIKEKLQYAYRALRNEYRSIFEDNQNHKSPILINDPRYEIKASAWYYVTYHPDWVQRTLENNAAYIQHEHLLLSFPWICVDYLAKIKMKKRNPTADYSSLLLSFNRSMMLKE